mmetsp:Transcript_36140/g.93246  ORF Transcript_36140/g.93246 Transcript_36140/m.93246 type:complete len:425 (+) Transcript_36140:1421-2695(+)
MPVVAAHDRGCARRPQRLRRVVDLGGRREVHLVPERHAVQHAVLGGLEADVRLPRHLDLALGEIELEDLVHRAHGPPRLVERVVVEVAGLVEGPPARLVACAPVQAVRPRPPRADDLCRRAQDGGSHGHDHVVRRQQLALRVVDFGEDALADEARVEELVVEDRDVDAPGEVVDVLAVGVDDRQLVRRAVDEAHLLLLDAVAGRRGKVEVRDVEGAVRGGRDDLRCGQIPLRRQQRQAAAEADEEPPRVVAHHVVLHTLAVRADASHELVHEVAHPLDVGLDRRRALVQQAQPLLREVHLGLALQEERDGLRLLGVAVIHAAGRRLGVESPLPARRIPDRVHRLGAAVVVPVDQVGVEGRLEGRRRRLLVAEHGLQLALLHLGGGVVLVAEDDLVRIVGIFLLLLFLGLRLGQRVELGVVRGVL